MKNLLTFISFLGLILVVGPAIVYLRGSIDKEQMNLFMLTGTVLWFVSAPFWMNKNRKS